MLNFIYSWPFHFGVGCGTDIPSCAAVESSFSAVRRIHTWQRNKLGRKKTCQTSLYLYEPACCEDYNNVVLLIVFFVILTLNFSGAFRALKAFASESIC